MATCLGIHEVSQLRDGYGREQADVVMNIKDNIISSHVTGDAAKQLSQRLGKIIQYSVLCQTTEGRAYLRGFPR